MAVKSFTLLFYLQWIPRKHTRREREWETSSTLHLKWFPSTSSLVRSLFLSPPHGLTHPKTQRELQGKVKKTTQPSSVSDPPTDLIAIASFRPTHQSRCYQTHVTDLPFSLYPCQANHRKTSYPPWPSRLRLAILPPPPLDQTQSPLSLPSSLNLTRFDEFFGLVWYYIFVWKLRKCEHQVENVFSMVFSRTQPNTKKYFSKYFLKCHQIPENIFS